MTEIDLVNRLVIILMALVLAFEITAFIMGYQLMVLAASFVLLILGGYSCWRDYRTLPFR